MVTQASLFAVADRPSEVRPMTYYFSRTATRTTLERARAVGMRQLLTPEQEMKPKRPYWYADGQHDLIEEPAPFCLDNGRWHANQTGEPQPQG